MLTACKPLLLKKRILKMFYRNYIVFLYIKELSKALYIFFIFPDQAYIIRKCSYLINEMINVIAQLVAGAYRNGRSKLI